MGFPLAVAASVKTPGLALSVDLLAGTASPGTAPLKVLMIATQSTSGTGTPDTTRYEAIAGEADAELLLGPGMPGHLAAVALFAEYALASVDLVIPASPSGAAASETIVFAGTVTTARTVRVWVKGVFLSFVWSPGETATDAGDELVALVGQNTKLLPVTAANVSGTVTLTAKDDGVWGNTVRIRGELVGGAGGTMTVTAAVLSSGAGEANYDNVLGLVNTLEYDFILCCCSEADVEDGSATSEIGAVKTHVDGLDSGFEAKLQQIIAGSNNTISGAKAGTDALNHGPTEIVLSQLAESLGCEFAGAETGARVREEAADPAVNRIRMPYQATLHGPADPGTDDITPTEVEDLLNNGATPVGYDTTRTAHPIRPVTSYHTDAVAAPDFRLLDVSRVSGTYAVAKDLRTAIPQEYDGSKLSPDLVPGDDPPPEGVVTPTEVKGFIRQRIRFWINRGVVRQDKFDTALALGTFIVRVNPSDGSQLDLVLPIEIFPPLAKYSLVLQHTGT